MLKFSVNTEFRTLDDIYLFVTAQVQIGRSEYVGQCPEPMKQHGGELDDYD